MKRLVEEVENEGLLGLMGQTITCFCANYFYTGELVGVNTDDIKLKNPKIVYQTGDWGNQEWSDAQALPTVYIYVRTSFIESYGVLK
jgi:hypothetical protein